MDAPPELLPHLPALFQDLEDLGARARDVVSLLEGQPLSSGSRVLDLGCGKGAAAISMARRFGVSVRGVDGMPDFIEHCRAQAREHGVENLCTFEVEDVRETVLSASDYDLVTFLALGPLFGEADETIEVLRECVRPGGLVLIDDAFVADGHEPPQGAYGCYDHSTTIRLLESHGDRVIGERVMDSPENEAWCRAMTGEILRRAEELAQRHPELADALITFAERQQRETEVLCEELVGAMWLVQIRP